MLEYLRSQDQFVDQLLQHLATSAVMDLLCHLVAGMEDTEPRQAAFAVRQSAHCTQSGIELLCGATELDMDDISRF